MRTRRALRELPLEAEQMLEEIVAELRRRGGPGHFETAGDGVGTLARIELADPAAALRFEIGRFRIHAHVARRSRAMGLAKAVAAGDKRDSLFVIHRHPRKGLAGILRRGEWIRVAVRPFRIHIDETQDRKSVV